ncbi:unnamed protein product [Brassica oleracea]
MAFCSPTNPHFFQPLLPGFTKHLDIPVAFFLKHLDKSNKGKTAKLRSDASETTWNVKLDGRRFTDGWEYFAVAHDLRVGDIVVFRHEGELVFYVTALGPSCCEIQYGEEDSQEDDKSEELCDTMEKISRMKKRPKTEKKNSEDQSCFVITVTESNLRRDIVYLPKAFAVVNCLMKKLEIVLMNEERESWKLYLTQESYSSRFYMSKGWRSFCVANGKKPGDMFTFKMVQNEATPVLKLLPLNNEDLHKLVDTEEVPKKKRQEIEADSSFVAIVTASNIRRDTMYLPKKFAASNGLKSKFKIDLMNEKGESWTIELRHEPYSGRFRIRSGWRSFCVANGKKPGDMFNFKLIRNVETPVLKLFPLNLPKLGKFPLNMHKLEPSNDTRQGFEATEKEFPGVQTNRDDSRQEPTNEAIRKGKWLEANETTIKEENITTSENRFVTLILTTSKLDLPKEFASSNLLEKECRKIVLRDRWERSWAMDLAFNKSSDTFNIRQGWRSFCDENGKKAGSFFVFKLIGNRETPLLSLCSTESTSNKNNTESCVEHSTTPPIKSRLMTLTIEHASFRKGSLRLPLRFMKKHGLDKPRLITLLGKDGTKWVANLRRESSGGRMRLGKGWKDFALDNGLKVGDSFTFELVGKNNTPPMLSLIRTKSTSDTRQPSSGNKTREGKKTTEERRDSSSAMKNQLVTLTLTPEDVRACQLFFETMAKSTLLHPQFFHTLVPGCGFHTHLIIPLDFFSKYIEGRSVDNTAQLKSDSSDITWQVKMSGPILSDGWREFTVAHSLQAGHLILVRYEGDMVFHVSHCLEIPSNNNKHSHPRTDVDDLPNKKKRAKTNSNETEADSSSLDNSCFVATVTSFNLLIYTLYLPQHFTSSNGLTRESHKIVLIDGEGRSWTLDLRFNASSDTFYMTRGWRSFCEENGQEAGGFFTFKLVGNGETLVLSFRPTESTSSTRQRDSSEEEDTEWETGEDEPLMETEKKKCNPKGRAVPYSSIERLSLPKQFLRENGINKPGEICLLDKDGMKWPTSLLRDKKGIMSLGKGWKEFVKSNGLASGFTLKLIWEDTTPAFSLCCPESTSDKEQQEYFKHIKKQSLYIDPSNNGDNSSKDSSPSSQNRLVTIKIRPDILTCNRMRLPKQFVMESNMNKPGTIYLLGKDDTKWTTKLVKERDGRMKLGSGWTVFAEANGFKPGESVTLESVWEDGTPMIRFLRTGSNSSKDTKKESVSMEVIEPRTSGSSSEIHDRFVTLTLLPEDVKAGVLIIPSQLLEANGVNKLGKITILGEKKMELSGYLLSRGGTVALENGWGEFCEANGVKLGESFTLEFIKKPDKTTHLEGKRSRNLENMVSQHFFQPLLPGFHSHLTIPVAFCSKHVEGRNEHMTTAKLRSDISDDITWKVKIEDGRKLTDGWKEFALAHDLRVGDIVIFRQEKDMAFHITLFGPSCCEIQYGSCLKKKNKLKLSKIQNKKKVKKKNKKKYVESSLLDPSCFVNNVRPSSLRDNRLTLPKRFVRENGLETRCGEIVLMNEKGRSWNLNLARKDSCGTMSITGGWKSFCNASGLRAGSLFTFKLIKRGDTLVLLKSPSSIKSAEEDCLEAYEIEPDREEASNQDEKPRLLWKASTSSPSQKKPRSLWKASTSSPSQNLFLTLTLKTSDVKNSRLFIPVNFTRLHGINKETEMAMLDKNGVKWSTSLRSETSGGDRIRLVGGWKEFFKANCVEIGESIIVKLIWEGDKSCVLEFYSKVKQETK